MRILLLLVFVAWHAENLNLVSGVWHGGPSWNFKDSIRSFARKSLMAIARDNPGNLVYSPLGASMVLTMAAFGARGETASRMRLGLELPVNDSSTKIEMNSMLRNMKVINDYELSLGNNIFVTNRCSLKTEFMTMTRSVFMSQAYNVDFSKPEQTSLIINGWIGEETENRVDDVVSPDSISGATELLLVNAAYFKGNWALRFDSKLTTLREFHVDHTTVRNVPTMYNSDYFNHGWLDELDATFIQLPYAVTCPENALSMYVILPNKKDGLCKLVKKFETFSVYDLIFGKLRVVNVYLPKFKIESSINLQRPLGRIDFKDIFTRSADFGNISEKPLVVSGIRQKALIEVNERGNATCNRVRMYDKKLPPEYHHPIDFIVDHPFMAVIMDANETPLFIATVNNPTGFDSFGNPVEKLQTTNGNHNPTK